MKKQMKWLLAALALAALATPAFAINADMTGTLAVRAIATNNLDGNGDAQDHTRGLDQRFRLFTSVAANENVRAVLGLEVDNVWGRTGATGKEVGTMGSDASGAALEIKHLYLDFKIPALGANVKAGTQPFNFGRGLIINDDAAGLAISQPCPAFPDNKLDLTWIKTSEGTAVKTDDEGDFYGAKYTMKVAGIAIAPYAGYYIAGNAAPTGATTGTPPVPVVADTHAAFFGADVDGKAGPFGYALTAIYNNWSRGTVEGNSVSLYGKGTLDLAATTLSLEAGRYGDEDNGGNAMSLAQNAATGPVQNISEILTGGMYIANSAIPTNVNGAVNLYLTNWLYAKVGVVQKLTDSMKVSAYVAHIQQAEDRSATLDAITYGQELDTYFDYTIVPGLGLNLMGAYLLANDDFGKTATVEGGDNAWKLATSLNYKF